MKTFFSHLRYSFGNEDWRTEEKALDIQPQDQVLCITASGDRPLNLLNRECEKIVCLDANPIQNHLLELKVAALHQLDYQSYVSFLGAIPGKGRKETLQLLLPHMNQRAAQFWLKHEKMVGKGILYQGSVERLTRVIAKFFSFTKGKKVRRLFAIDNIDEQRQFLREEWDSRLLRILLNTFLNTFLSRVVIEDPGLTNYSSDIKPGHYLYDRMHASLERELAKKNPLLSLLFRGRVSSEAFSPYLTEVGTEAIRPQLSALKVHTGDILDYLESVTEPTFNGFSLSDVASYMSYPNFVRLLKGVVRAARPGARFCLRQFLSSYEIPESLQPYFIRKNSLEKELEHLDNCFVYRFMTGTIVRRPMK